MDATYQSLNKPGRVCNLLDLTESLLSSYEFGDYSEDTWADTVCLISVHLTNVYLL
jgi:hypothetical protein